MAMEWCFPAMKECGGPRCMALVGIDWESILATVEGAWDFACKEGRWNVQGGESGLQRGP